MSDIIYEKLGEDNFDKVYNILVQSFPEDERRTYIEQKNLLNENSYSIYAFRNDKRIVAFISVWQFENFSYIEHFAVDSSMRNNGLGRNILRKIIPHLNGIVCLEAELPETELAKRRISFYERNGFYTNEFSYVQPPYSKGKNPIELIIMTYGRKINDNEFQNIKNNLYNKVYKVKNQEDKNVNNEKDLL